jgi:hypothetical protein
MNPNATWIRASIIAGSVMFVLSLAISAVFLPQWRALHVMQALPYVAVVILTGRRNAWGYGAGVFMASFWNFAILFRSPVGVALVHGDIQRPDIVVQLFAALGHFLIIVACLVGFWRTRPAGRQWREFVAGGATAIGYLLVMIWTVGPPEAVEHIKQAFWLR